MMELKTSGKPQLLLKYPYQECDRMGLSASRIVLSPCEIIPLPLLGMRLPGWSCTPDLQFLTLLWPHGTTASASTPPHVSAAAPNLYLRPLRLLTTDSQIHMMLYTEAKNSE